MRPSNSLFVATLCLLIFISFFSRSPFGITEKIIEADPILIPGDPIKNKHTSLEDWLRSIKIDEANQKNINSWRFNISQTNYIANTIVVVGQKVTYNKDKHETIKKIIYIPRDNAYNLSGDSLDQKSFLKLLSVTQQKLRIFIASKDFPKSAFYHPAIYNIECNGETLYGKPIYPPPSK
jgi:hypothetical protein